jgi:hypothetical protein
LAPLYSMPPAILNVDAARARSRCLSIAASKPAWSTDNPRSRQTSAVKSKGKPKVS